MYNYRLSKHVGKIIAKLQKKDKQLYENLMNKMKEIINSSDVEHYKNLKYNFKEYKRVHVGSFVLVFKFDRLNNLILFDDFNHHDIIYKK